jgi:beta-fructofuranosidase
VADADCFVFEARVRVAAGTRSFALRLFEDEATGDAYAFMFLVGENRVVFDKRPNYPWFRYDNRGLERPLALDADREYEVRIVVDGTIATLYVDGVALNARMYDKTGRNLVADVVDGALEILDARVRRLGAAR